MRDVRFELENLVEPRPLPEPLGVSGWLRFPSTFSWERETAVPMEVIEDALTLFRPYGIDTIVSSEPRSYRLTARGLRALDSAFKEGQVESVAWCTPSRGPGGPARTGLPDAQFNLSLPTKSLGGASGELSILIQHATASSYPHLLREVTSFVIRWFAMLDAANAFVSHYAITNSGEVGDHPSITRYERRLGAVLGPYAAKRFVRGVFWGMGLGAELCGYLGGRSAILQNAPAAQARQIGDGVWLQASQDPPGEERELTRLAAYVNPLMGSADEIRSTDAMGIAAWRGSQQTAINDRPLQDVGPIAEKISPPTPIPSPIPIRGLRALLDLENDAVLNLHLERPPTKTQLAHVVATMQAWYQQGFEGNFGGGGFHSLSGPSVDGTVLRWKVDFGSAGAGQAMRVLAVQLAVLTDVKISKLVVGTESVG